MMASYHFSGKETRRPEAIEVVLSQQYQSKAFVGWEEKDNLEVQVADKHYKYAATLRTAPLGDGESQTVTISIPLTDFQQMVKGESILFKMGWVYEPIEDGWIKPLEALLATLPDKKTP